MEHEVGTTHRSLLGFAATVGVIFVGKSLWEGRSQVAGEEVLARGGEEVLAAQCVFAHWVFLHPCWVNSRAQ